MEGTHIRQRFRRSRRCPEEASLSITLVIQQSPTCSSGGKVAMRNGLWLWMGVGTSGVGAIPLMPGSGSRVVYCGVGAS